MEERNVGSYGYKCKYNLDVILYHIKNDYVKYIFIYTYSFNVAKLIFRTGFFKLH